MTNATALGTLAAVNVADGTTLNIGATQTLGALNNAGTTLNNGSVLIGAFTLTIGSTNNLPSLYTGNITGSSSAVLTIAGTGGTTLGGTVNIGSGNTNNLNVSGTSKFSLASGGSLTASNLVMANGAAVNLAGNWTSTAAQGSAQQLIRGTVTQTAGVVNVRGVDLADTSGDTASYYLGGTGAVTAAPGQYDSLSVGARGVSNFYVSGSGSLTVTGSGESQTSNSDTNQLTVGSVFGGDAGTSKFVQQGGTVTTNGLSLGSSAVNNTVTPGIYYLNGGTLTKLDPHPRRECGQFRDACFRWRHI